VGWRRDAAERLPVDAIARAAAGAHRDAVQRSPRYRHWRAEHPVEIA